jgi:hypothetical protein
MNKLALAIQTFPGANEAFRRHWHHFLKSGADEYIPITTTDGGCWSPEGTIPEMIGANIYIQGAHLPMRLLRTLQRLRETKCDWFCVAEYDVLLLRPIPRDLPEGITTHLAGHKMPGHHCEHFYHNPWVMDRETAEVVVRVGYELIAAKTIDASPDCFLGQIIDKAKIPVHTDILKSYSRNTIHGETWIAEARAAVDAGAVCVHGVKDQQTFDALTK